MEKRVIGIVSMDVEDFRRWLNQNGFDTGEYKKGHDGWMRGNWITPKHIFYNNKTEYRCVTKITDICSMTYDEVFFTSDFLRYGKDIKKLETIIRGNVKKRTEKTSVVFWWTNLDENLQYDVWCRHMGTGGDIDSPKYKILEEIWHKETNNSDLKLTITDNYQITKSKISDILLKFQNNNIRIDDAANELLTLFNNSIDAGYIAGVFNVSGIDGLVIELNRLKEMSKRPCDIFGGPPLPDYQKEKKCKGCKHFKRARGISGFGGGECKLKPCSTVGVGIDYSCEKWEENDKK